MQKLGFVAYPDGHLIIADAINGVVERCREAPLALKSWPAMNIIGFKVDDQVRANVIACSVLGCVDGFNQHQPARKTDNG